jgi:hypothetical protein
MNQEQRSGCENPTEMRHRQKLLEKGILFC